MSAGISLTQAAFIPCFAIAYGAINPSSLLGHVGTIALGALGAFSAFVVGLSYDPLEIQSEGALIKERLSLVRTRHASHKRADVVYSDFSAHKEEFQRSFDRFKTIPAFGMWCTREGHANEKEAFDSLKKHLDLGTCQGQTSEIFKALFSEPAKPSKDLLEGLTIEDIFYSQMLSHMHFGFSCPLIAKKCKPEDWTRLLKETPGDASQRKVFIQELETLLYPCHSRKGERLSLNVAADDYVRQLQAVIEKFDPSLSEDRILVADISLQIYLNGREPAGHSIALQCSHGHYRFYDSSLDSFAGIYDYPDLSSCLGALRSLFHSIGMTPSDDLSTFQFTIYSSNPAPKE